MDVESPLPPHRHPTHASAWRQSCKCCLTACTVGLGCCRVAVKAMQEAPRWRYGNCCCWTAHRFSTIRDGEDGFFIWSPSPFHCRGGMKCFDHQCWVIVALPWCPAVSKGCLASSSPNSSPMVDSRVTFFCHLWAPQQHNVYCSFVLSFLEI